MSEGIKKYGGILLKGSAAVSVANASTKLVGFILIPIFTYYLSPEDYGLVAMVSIVVTFLNLFYNPGMVSATMRLYHDTDDENERKELIGSAHRFFLFFPLIFIAVGLIFGDYIFEKAFNDFKFYPFGLIALILAFFSQPKRIWVTFMTLQYKVHITAIYSAISVILGLLTTAFLVVVLEMGAMGKVLGMFPSVLIFFFLSFSTIRKYAGDLWSFASIKKQLRFGFPLIIAIWSYEFLHIADRYILERMTSLNDVGIYSFGYHLAELPMFLILGVKQLWNPIFYENMNKGDYKTISKLINYFISFLTLINIGVLLFSKEAVVLFINPRFYDAIPVIGVIIVGVYFNGLLTISNSILAFKKKFGTTSKIALIATVICIVLNILLIPSFGIMGSAIATMIAYFLYFLMGLWHQRETIQLLQERSLTVIPILCIFAILGLNLTLNHFFKYEFSWLEVLIKVLAFITVCTVFYYYKLLGKKEVFYVVNLIKTKRNKSKK